MMGAFQFSPLWAVNVVKAEVDASQAESLKKNSTEEKIETEARGGGYRQEILHFAMHNLGHVNSVEDLATQQLGVTNFQICTWIIS